MALPPVGRRTIPTPSRRQALVSTSSPSGWPKPSDTVGGSHAKNRSVGGDVSARRPSESASSTAMLVAPSAGSVTSSRQGGLRESSVTPIASHGTVAPALPSRGRRLPVGAPDHREADRQPAVGGPLGLLSQPRVVDQAFLHLSERPAGGVRGPHVVAEEMDVAADRDRLARRAVEVRGYTGHQELRMKAHDDEEATVARDPRRFAVEGSKISEMLVGQRLDAEI